MKKWMKKHKLRLIVSLVMLAAAVVLGIILDGFSGPGSEMWQRFIYIVIVMGTGLSALGGAAFGLWGFAGGYGLVLLICLPRVLPEPFDRYFAIIYFVVLIAYPYIKAKKKKKNKPQENEASYDVFLEDEELPQETVSEEQSGHFIIANNIYSGRWYQIFRRGGFVYAYYVGGELKGPRAELLQTMDTHLRPLGKKDISFAVEDISRVKVKDISNGAYNRVAIIKAGKKSFRFWELGRGDDSFLDFWRALSATEVLDKESLAELAEPEPDKKRMSIAGKLKIAYAVYFIAVVLAWLFLRVPYELFAVLNLLAMPLLFVIYFLFPGEITMSETKKNTKKHSIAMLTMFSGIGLTLRAFLDFNINNWGRMFLTAGIIAVIFLAVFLICSKEWRKKKSVWACIIFGMVFYSVGAAMEINYLLDFNEPMVEDAIIEDMRISTSSNSPDSYIIEVVKEDGSTQDIEISEGEYEAFSIGDDVEVLTYPGFLGIQYVMAD